MALLFFYRCRGHQRATIVIFGHAIWDPDCALSTFHSKTTIVIAMGSIAVATLATNIAANVVSPANDFSHLAPRIINFRIGGFITGLVGIAMMPWKLYADPNGYIFTWLIAYSALLGARRRDIDLRLLCPSPHGA